MAHPPHSFIADGFADDCDELIHRCLKETPVTYKGFSKVFKDMQMSCIFHDRQSGAEIAELSEEVVNIAKYYMVANTGYIEESIIGLFLVYALVKIQPFEDFAHLRLVEEDVPYIERIEQVARRDKRFDVLYVMAKLLIENTRYYAAARERGMEPAYRKYLEGCSTVDTLGLRPKGVFLRQNEELDIIKELKGLQKQYDEAKLNVKAAELTYTNPKFATDLESSLNDIICGLRDHNTIDDEPAEVQEDTVRNIKDKAMKAKVNPIRHLIAVNDRISTVTSNATSTSLTSNVDKASEDTTESPTEQVTTTITETTTTESTSKKRKRVSSDSCDYDEEFDSDGIDIDLENFDRAKPTSSKLIEPASEATEIEVESCKLELGAIPCLFASDNTGQSYEIEIIDKFKQSANKLDTPTARTKFVIAAENAVRHKSRKPKSELKKTILKSRFKRMGIAPIANFKNA